MAPQKRLDVLAVWFQPRRESCGVAGQPYGANPTDGQSDGRSTVIEVSCEDGRCLPWYHATAMPLGMDGQSPDAMPASTVQIPRIISQLVASRMVQRSRTGSQS